MLFQFSLDTFCIKNLPALKNDEISTCLVTLFMCVLCRLRNSILFLTSLVEEWMVGLVGVRVANNYQNKDNIKVKLSQFFLKLSPGRQKVVQF